MALMNDDDDWDMDDTNVPAPMDSVMAVYLSIYLSIYLGDDYGPNE